MHTYTHTHIYIYIFIGCLPAAPKFWPPWPPAVQTPPAPPPSPPPGPPPPPPTQIIGPTIRLRVKGALCAQVIRLRVSYNQIDETLSRNSLMYMSKANLPIAGVNPDASSAAAFAAG